MKKVVIIFSIVFLCIIGVVGVYFLKLSSKEENKNSPVTKETHNNVEEVLEKTEEVEEEKIEPIVWEVPLQDTERHKIIQGKVEEIAKKYNAVGISIIKIEDGKLYDSFNYGEATIGSLPMTSNSIIRIASISKSFIGMATLLSVEKGVMSLDDNISKYWGFDVATHAEGDVITARSILTHTSSIMDLSADYKNAFSDRISSYLKTGSGIRTIKSGNIANWVYNNYAIDVLGVTVERANNKQIDDILSENIFGPLEIDAAFYGCRIKNKDLIGSLYDHGIVERTGKNLASLCYTGAPGIRGDGFAGDLLISSFDLAKIVAVWVNDGTYNGVKFLSPSLIEELEYHGDKFQGEFYQAQPLRYYKNIFGQDELYTIGGNAYGSHNVISYNPNTKEGLVAITIGAYQYMGGKSIQDALSEILYSE